MVRGPARPRRAVALFGLPPRFQDDGRATDSPVNNTARHVLWLPVASEVKFKGKPTIDSLFARIGDGLAALTVLVGVRALDLATGSFFAFNVALVLVWIFYALVVVREHRRLTEGSPADAAP